MPTDEGTLQRKPLKEEVFDVLHRDILSGEYVAGSWLRQQEIARRLGVSMTPVREALDLLVSAGLAERVAYKGVRLLRPSKPEILDAYEMRLMLEGPASRAAAESITKPQLAALAELLDEGDRLLKLDDLIKERAISTKLHIAIVAAAGNALLDRAYRQVLRAFPDWMLYEHLFRMPGLLEGSLQNEHREHRRIVDALRNGDPDAAEAMAIEHILQRGRELEQHLGIPRRALHRRESRCALLSRSQIQPAVP